MLLIVLLFSTVLIDVALVTLVCLVRLTSSAGVVVVTEGGVVLGSGPSDLGVVDPAIGAVIG